MPDIPISQLPEVTTPAATDVIPIVDGVTTKKVQVANLYAASSGSSLVGFLQAGTGAVARTVQGKLRDIIWHFDFLPDGFVTDGSVDYSTQIQSAIVAAAGKTLVIGYGSYLAAGLSLDGSTFNNTRIICLGELKLKADGGASNFDTSIWSGLLVRNCDNIDLDLRWDGNRSAMTSREGIHCTDIAAATNVRVRSFVCREIRGDGLYIDRASPLNSGVGANSQNVHIDFLFAYNSANDGRNACSVISCDGLTIGALHSYQVGGIVNSTQMPGGLDLEPNWPIQSITDVVIGSVNVVTAGTGGLTISGKAATNDATRDWNIQRVSIGTAMVRNTDPAGNPRLRRCRDVTVDIISMQHSGSRGLGGDVDYADRVFVNSWTAKFCTYGVLVGFNDFVQDSEIKVRVNDYSSNGLLSVGIRRTLLTGRIYGATAANAAIQLSANARGALTQTDVVYQIDAPFDGTNGAAFANDGTFPITIGAGTCIRSCDFTGYSTISGTIPVTIDWFNVRGVVGEGTFTPTLNSFTVVLGGGTVTTTGTYRKEGKFVTVTVRIAPAGGATVAATNGIGSFISGLPFSAVANAAGRWVNSSNVNASGGVMVQGTALYLTDGWAASGATFDFTATYPL